MAETSSSLDLLRDWIVRAGVPENARLPPERTLCKELGLSRSSLRAALAMLEAEGRLWRHVGRGTFYGPRPPMREKNHALLSGRTHPDEVMEVRLVIEPRIAALAAMRATAEDLAEIDRCLSKADAAQDFAAFELWDSALHEALARAARNSLLHGLFEAVNGIRKRRIWGRLKTVSLSPERLRLYGRQHRACVAAVRDRDAAAAEHEMRAHLETVRRNLFDSGAGGPPRVRPRGGQAMTAGTAP